MQQAYGYFEASLQIENYEKIILEFDKFFHATRRINTKEVVFG